MSTQAAEDSEQTISSYYSAFPLLSSTLLLAIATLPCPMPIRENEMASQRLLLLVALLFLTLLAAAESDVDAGSANDTAAALDARTRKWWRFPPTEGLVRGSERRVPNSSDPLHNR
jgi:hypothetical protein